MRAGLATSVTLHALILGWGLVNLSAPDAFDVDDVEALPIELVSIDELTQIQEGAEDAPKDGPASPEPTVPPTPDPDAVNIGNQELDQSTPETETQKAAEVEEARLPDPVDVPVPRPSPREEPEPVIEETPEPESTPATEVAPVPEPREEVTPDPVEEAITAAEPEPEPQPEPEPVEEFVELPSELPTPQARPEPPQPVETADASEDTAPAQTAKTPERKKEENQQTQSAAQQEQTEEKADEVASLLNREQGSGGGSQANNQQASAGGERTTTGNTLTQSEMDSLRGQIQACWSVPANAQGEEGLRVSVQFQLTQGATIEGKPRVTSSSGNRQLDESAVRAVARCGAKGFQLPPDKFDSWRDVVVNFDPSEMFR